MTLILDQDKPHMEEVLEHHGILGMKWGVRRENLSGGSISGNKNTATRDPKSSPTQVQRRVAKAATFDARAAKSNIRVSELKQELKDLPIGVKTAYKRNMLRQDLEINTDYRDRLLKDAKAVRNGKMTSTQKKLLVGGLVVAGLAGFVLYSQMKQSGQLNSLALRGAAFMKGQKFDFKKDASLAEKKLSPNTVLSRVVKGLNPNYNSPGGQMNCRRCTFAYEMRRRGNNVVATPSALGWGQSETGLINALTTTGRNQYDHTSLSSMIAAKAQGIRGQVGGDLRSNPAKLFSIADASVPKNVLSTLAKQPDGARGEIVFNFKQFGHSMAYENFNGKPVIFDTQKGIKYEGEKGLRDLMGKWGQPANAEVTRLDNVDLDKEFLSRWLTNK